MSPPRTVTIWHNPRCGKSRQTLELLRKKGVEPTIREYLKQPPSRFEVEKLIDLVGGDPGALIRDDEREFKALKKKKAEFDRVDIAKAIAAHPILLQRPIVVAGARAAIGRPPEAVLPLLK
jgi:arsenate reductase